MISVVYFIYPTTKRWSSLSDIFLSKLRLLLVIIRLLNDDWVGPDYLERLMAPVLADASIDMVIGGIRYYFVRKNKYSDMFRYTENKYSLINGHGMLIRDGILKNGCPVAKLFSKRIITNNNLSTIR